MIPKAVCLFMLFSALSMMSLCPVMAGNKPELTVVSDIWPPFITGDKERPGIDVEVMLKVFEQLDIKVSFSIYPWKRALTMVEKGKADALLDVFNTPDRLSNFWFPNEPMNQTETALFCNGCDNRVALKKSIFIGKTLLINHGYRYSRFGNDPDIQKVSVKSFEQGFKMLAGNRADYYLANRYVGLFTLSELNLKNIRVFKEGIEDPSPAYLGFHRSDRLFPLHHKFSDSLRQFKQSNEYWKILQRYGVEPALQALSKAGTNVSEQFDRTIESN